MKKSLLVCGVPAVAFAAWALHAMYSDPPLGPQGESVPPDEATYSAQIIASGISMLNTVREKQPDHVYRRDAHARTHGCALATFTVNPVEERWKQGLFATPKEYKAWVRFSSGSTDVQSSWKPDARGMAIKVLGVPGRKLLEGEENETTQDFLMINNPEFFIANVEEYALSTAYQAQNNPFGYFASDGRNFTWNFLKWRMREFRIGLEILKFPPKNLLAVQYYSMTAYKLGAGQYVKYTNKPVACSAATSVPGARVGFGSNALTDQLAAELRAGPSYCFDLMVQPQVAGKNMPVEDPTIGWSERDSPFVPIARIRLERQDIAPQMQSGFCENLSFTPWHALPAHEPVGGLNRVRKVLYSSISRYRRCLNGKASGEPKEDGSMAFNSKPCIATEPIPQD
jgi:catalase